MSLQQLIDEYKEQALNSWGSVGSSTLPYFLRKEERGAAQVYDRVVRDLEKLQKEEDYE